MTNDRLQAPCKCCGRTYPDTEPGHLAWLADHPNTLVDMRTLALHVLARAKRDLESPTSYKMAMSARAFFRPDNPDLHTWCSLAGLNPRRVCATLRPDPRY